MFAFLRRAESGRQKHGEPKGQEPLLVNIWLTEAVYNRLDGRKATQSITDFPSLRTCAGPKKYKPWLK